MGYVDTTATENDDVTTKWGHMYTDSYIILSLTISMVLFNTLTLLVHLRTELRKTTCINRYFFLSFTVVDLLFGLTVAPFSFWTSRFQTWIYSLWFCHLEAYLSFAFWIISLYSLMWICIDHFLAVRKVERYESIMTPMKSKCWMIFVWFGAIVYSCPALFGVAETRYYEESYICIADWTKQRAYLMTSGVLICLPPVITIIFSNCYIFTRSFRENALVFEKTSSMNSRPDAYIRNFLISIFYFLSWLPWLSVMLHELIYGGVELSVHKRVHFYAMWLAIGNAAWKFVIYVCFDQDFRAGLKELYNYVCVCKGPFSMNV